MPAINSLIDVSISKLMGIFEGCLWIGGRPMRIVSITNDPEPNIVSEISILGSESPAAADRCPASFQWDPSLDLGAGVGYGIYREYAVYGPDPLAHADKSQRLF